MGNSDDTLNDTQGDQDTDYGGDDLTWDEVAQEVENHVEEEQSSVLDGGDPTRADKNTSDNWGIFEYIETRKRLNDAPIDSRFLTEKDDYNPFLGHRLQISSVFPYQNTMTLENATKRMFASTIKERTRHFFK
ncbi:hypothetical protein AG0111_0g7232 [Alternaria gaisen]|uniref:Uncharacterized protein n=1 Tax=Alternaria gaisen TaxID=167740 RepID=A0ACB6FID9_9PLEO|nr:hypothetical protein AG0111_0g7232 [Alternaria gaisen]